MVDIPEYDFENTDLYKNSVINSNPKFHNTDNLNFHIDILDSAAKGIGNGAYVPEAPTDLDGITDLSEPRCRSLSSHRSNRRRLITILIFLLGELLLLNLGQARLLFPIMALAKGEVNAIFSFQWLHPPLLSGRFALLPFRFSK